MWPDLEVESQKVQLEILKTSLEREKILLESEKEFLKKERQEQYRRAIEISSESLVKLMKSTCEGTFGLEKETLQKVLLAAAENLLIDMK